MYLIGKRYEVEKKIISNEKGHNQYTRLVGGNCCHQPNQPPTAESETNSSSLKTRDRLAEEYGIAARTIQTDAQFSKAVDAMPPETKEKILSGEEKVSKNDMMNLHRMDVSSSKRVNLWVSNLAKMKILTLSIKQQYFDEIMAGTKKEEYRQIKASTADRYISYKIGDQVLTSNKELTAKQIQDAELVPVKYDAIKFLTGAYSGKRPWAIVEVEDIIINHMNAEMIYCLGKVIERSDY